MTSFDEKVLLYLEDIEYFVNTIKKIYVISNCPINPCAIGLFADELYNYVHSQRRSFRLVNFFS